jgi:hypothetical protein
VRSKSNLSISRSGSDENLRKEFENFRTHTFPLAAKPFVDVAKSYVITVQTIHVLHVSESLFMID